MFLCEESATTEATEQALTHQLHNNPCLHVVGERTSKVEGEITRAHTILGVVRLSTSKNIKSYNSWNPGIQSTKKSFSLAIGKS